MNPPTSDFVESHANDRFVARYVSTSEHHLPELPTFASSIDVFKDCKDNTKIFESLSKNVSCLFQGYTAPDNAQALERFLCHFGIKIADVLAIDLLDLPSIYKRLGVHVPPMRFIQGDACDLAQSVQSGSIDIVIQDFILNCLPTTFALSLFKETRRVLKPDGIALISFTDSSCLSASTSIREAVTRLNINWKPHASGIAEFAKNPSQLEEISSSLIGSTLSTEQEGHLIVVTPPEGRFEFFQPLSNTLDLIREAGLDVVNLQRSIGRDAADLLCMRNRCLLRSKI